MRKLLDNFLFCGMFISMTTTQKAPLVRLDWHNVNDNNQTELLTTLANGAGFASFEYRAKRNNELARHTLILGGGYINALERSIDALETSRALGTHVELGKLTARFEWLADNNRLSGDVPTGDALAKLVETATDAVLASWRKSLDAHRQGKQNEDYPKGGLYAPVTDADGNILKGITRHQKDGSLELHGLAHAKLVLEQGDPNTTKNRALTVVKQHVQNRVGIVSRWRTLALENVSRVRRNGDTIELA
jgi:hypothetical protein